MGYHSQKRVFRKGFLTALSRCVLDRLQNKCFQDCFLAFSAQVSDTGKRIVTQDYSTQNITGKENQLLTNPCFLICSQAQRCLCVVKRDHTSEYLDVLSTLSTIYWVKRQKISDLSVVESGLRAVLGAEAANDVMHKVREVGERA